MAFISPSVSSWDDRFHKHRAVPTLPHVSNARLFTDGTLINYPDTTKVNSVKKYGFVHYFHLVSCFPYFADFYFDKQLPYTAYYKYFNEYLMVVESYYFNGVTLCLDFIDDIKKINMTIKSYRYQRQEVYIQKSLISKPLILTLTVPCVDYILCYIKKSESS